MKLLIYVMKRGQISAAHSNKEMKPRWRKAHHLDKKVQDYFVNMCCIERRSQTACVETAAKELQNGDVAVEAKPWMCG